mgnify:CR=1 FL=1
MFSFSAIISILCTILALALSVSIYFNIKHAILIIEVQEAIEESLDILDVKYGKINEILKTPVFFDSLEVRQVLSEMSSCRDSILYVANTLTAAAQDENHDKQQEREINEL